MPYTSKVARHGGYWGIVVLREDGSQAGRCSPYASEQAARVGAAHWATEWEKQDKVAARAAQKASA